MSIKKPRKEAPPLGIMASFSKVTFKKDGAEVFSAKVTSGGCFGPDAEADVIDRGYHELNRAVKQGTADKAALDFNQVSVGRKDFTVLSKTATHVEVIDSRVGFPSAPKP